MGTIESLESQARKLSAMVANFKDYYVNITPICRIRSHIKYNHLKIIIIQVGIIKSLAVEYFTIILVKNLGVTHEWHKKIIASYR